ncbi:MAG TPA: 4-hydroxythreonine-4-phosphate dehydrogenase PdxA [Planctomycetota bacterium]|nr:4-hydroxythreonine-4-phosphate dehydrogenase PdxA [Planctomycetota bacterium]
MNTAIRPPSHAGKPRPIIAVTMGDAAGIGPELCLQLLARHKLTDKFIPLVIGDGDVLSRVSKAVNIPFNVPRLDAWTKELNTAAVLDLPGALAGDAVEPGKNQLICGRAAALFIREAIEGCLKARYAAMVTAPISKKALNMAGVKYPGHTEMLADLTRSANYAMLLYSEEIACAFVTCHQALRTVSDSLSVKRVVEVATLGYESVRTIRGSAPKLCMLGLNPHAGEEGLFGDEEERVLVPAMKELAAKGIDIEGPLPSDTAFTPAARKRYGLYIAMYHDQGGIPFKMLSFDTGVNVTMGLPIIRTSPDHGTAFDIAWKGKVRADSFLSAYDLAMRLALDARKRETAPPARDTRPHGDKKVTKRLSS